VLRNLSYKVYFCLSHLSFFKHVHLFALLNFYILCANQ
jgi:hypothetical protein